jgi:hypothetical protein
MLLTSPAYDVLVCLCMDVIFLLLYFSLRLFLLLLQNKFRGLSPQATYTDRATEAVGEVVPTFAARGCYVVTATDSHGR